MDKSMIARLTITLTGFAAALALGIGAPAAADTLVDNVQGMTIGEDGRVDRFTGLWIDDDGRIKLVLKRGDQRPTTRRQGPICYPRDD
jgi:hypothetical protein